MFIGYLTMNCNIMVDISGCDFNQNFMLRSLLLTFLPVIGRVVISEVVCVRQWGRSGGIAGPGHGGVRQGGGRVGQWGSNSGSRSGVSQSWSGDWYSRSGHWERMGYWNWLMDCQSRGVAQGSNDFGLGGGQGQNSGNNNLEKKRNLLLYLRMKTDSYLLK